MGYCAPLMSRWWRWPLPALAVFIAGVAGASPLEIFGFGGRSPALAETGVASADDMDALYLNPAGLAEVTGRRLSIGSVFGSFSLSGVDRPVDDAVAIGIGGAFRLPLGGALADRVGLGIALYVPTELLNRARAPTPGTPFFAVLENRSQVVGIQVGAGVRLTDELEVGAGVLALAALRGLINVAPDAAGRFTTTSEEQLTAGYAPILGARYRLGSRWSFGATLHFPSESTYDIHITNSIGEALPITVPELRIAGTAQYDPLILALEAAYRPRPDLLVTAQLSYDRWSDFPLPTQNVLALMPPQEPPNFSDTLVPRVAAEWTAGSHITLRAGYAFIPTPAPEATGAQAFVDNDRHLFTLGAGLTVAPIHVDAWAQAHVLAPRHNERPAPQPAVDTSGTILAGGMLLGVDL